MFKITLFIWTKHNMLFIRTKENIYFVLMNSIILNFICVWMIIIAIMIIIEAVSHFSLLAISHC